jgi:hypothetical protein
MVLVLFTTACSREPERKFRVISDKEQAEQFAKDNPVGRFTALPGGDGGIYVLDTRKGTVRFCASASSGTNPAGFEGVAVGCTQPSEVSGKQIAPNIRKLE